MNSALLVSAAALGFLGSFHCIGMCGPIALALPIHDRSFQKRSGGALIYNLGRITTYALLGVLFGLAGKSLAMAGWQRGLSIGAGVLLLALAFYPEHKIAQSKALKPLYRFVGKVRAQLARLFQQRSTIALFGIGTLNGLLPCGLVYVALAGAAATGEPLQGAFFMLLFGMGTAPAMFSVALLGKLIPVNVRTHIRRAVPFFVAAMGLLLVLRGMNLGIPYISPDIAGGACAKHSCCHR